MAHVSPIPKGMHSVTPTIIVKDCRKAIAFYRRAFGAEEVMVMPTPDGRNVWHAEIRIGDSVVFLGEEMPGNPMRAPTADRPANTLNLYVEDADATYRRAVEAGALPTMPIAEMFWGDRAGQVTDPFGYPWFISTHVKDLTREELRRGAEEAWRQMHPVPGADQGSRR